MQIVAADSSSLIYLSKAGLLLPFSQLVHLIISERVFGECTYLPWAEDAEEINGLVQQKKILVHSVPEFWLSTPPSLGQGERSTIELWYLSNADEMLIDDRQGIKICKQWKIPFICAILVPTILWRHNLLSCPEEALDLVEKICQIGRYAQWIIDYTKEAILSLEPGQNKKIDQHPV